MEKELCFVLMPFTVREIDKEKYPDPNHWNEVYWGLIHQSVEALGMECKRDDQDLSSRVIVENILKKIEDSRIIICDLSSHNPNVFLELGWALRADKPYVLIKDDVTSYPFDLNQQFIFNYKRSLQPTILKTEIPLLTECIQKTLDDEERRYSVVNRISISVSLIGAFKGDLNTALLKEIRQKLSELPNFSILVKSQQDQFPWPDLLQLGMGLLFYAKTELNNYNNISDQSQVITLLNNLTSKLGFKRNKNIQLSLIDSTRQFIYHDHDEVIGMHAMHHGLGDKDIYDIIFNYPHGAVAWVDRLSNVAGYVSPTYLRYNIGIFTTVDNTDCKLVVELHSEIT